LLLHRNAAGHAKEIHPFPGRCNFPGYRAEILLKFFREKYDIRSTMINGFQPIFASSVSFSSLVLQLS
jgi:hypothetical protein